MKKILNIIILFISTMIMFINCMPTSVMVNTKSVGNNIKAKRSTINNTNTQITPVDSTAINAKVNDGPISGSMILAEENKIPTPLSLLPSPYTNNNIEIRQQPQKRRAINPIEYDNNNNFDQQNNNNFDFNEPQQGGVWSNDLFDRHQNNYYTAGDIGDNYYNNVGDNKWTDDSYRPIYSNFESKFNNNQNYRNFEQEKLAQLRQYGLRLKRNSPLTSADLLALLAMAEASNRYRLADDSNNNGIGQNLIHNYNGVNNYYNNNRNIDSAVDTGNDNDDDDEEAAENNEWWLKSVVNKPSIEYYPNQMMHHPYDKLSLLENPNKSPMHFNEKYGSKNYLNGMQSSNGFYGVDSYAENDDGNNDPDNGEIPMGFDSRLFYDAPHNQQQQQQNPQNYYTNNRYV